KSPLMGFDDDALMKIAARRSGSLAEALAAADEGVAVEAARRLQGGRARGEGPSPLSFFSLLRGAKAVSPFGFFGSAAGEGGRSAGADGRAGARSRRSDRRIFGPGAGA